MSGGWVLTLWIVVICSPGVLTYLSDAPASSNLAVVSPEDFDGRINDGTSTPNDKESIMPESALVTQGTDLSDSPSEPLPTIVQNSDDEGPLATTLPPSTRTSHTDDIFHNSEEHSTILSSPLSLTSSPPAAATFSPNTTTLNEGFSGQDNPPTNTSFVPSSPPLIVNTDATTVSPENESTVVPNTTRISTTVSMSLFNTSDPPLNEALDNDSDVQAPTSTELPIVNKADYSNSTVTFLEQPTPALTTEFNDTDASSNTAFLTPTNATLPVVLPNENTKTATSAPSTTHGFITNTKEEINAKEAYLPPTVTYGSTKSPHHVYSKLTPAPELIPPQPSPYNWYLLILNGNCSSVMRRERRFEVYVRANLAEKVSVEFSDVLVTSVTCNTVLFVNVTVFGENQECINRTIFDLADTHALLVEFSGQMYNLTTVRTKTSMFGRKHYHPVQNYQNVSMEVMIYLAIGAVCLFIVLSALLIALMLCCKKSKKAKRDYSKPNSPWYVQIENYNMTKIPRPNSVYSDTSRSRTPRPNLFSAQKPSRYSDSSSTPLANDDSALMAPDDNRSSIITNRSSLTVATNQDDGSLRPRQPQPAATHRPKKSVEFAPIDDHTVPSDKMTPLSTQDKWGSLDGYDNFSYASL